MNQLPVKPTPEQALAWYQDTVAREGREPNRLLAKSSLYQRLLEGKKPLITAPPLAYSYPWYSIVESNDPQDIDAPFACAPGVFAVDDGIERVIINQSLWEVVSRGDDGSVSVTRPGWRERGFVWRAWRDLQPAASAAAYLICHHNPPIGRITTLEQLEAEAQYQAARWRSELAIVRDWKAGALDEAGAISALHDLHGYRESHQRERFLVSAIRQKLQLLSELFDARQRDLKRDDVSDEDFQGRIDHERNLLLGEHWKVQDGELFFDGWRLQRAAPASLDASHYLNLVEAVHG
jgi:hypothetical protein